MVKFRLISDTDNEAVYHYYPEGQTEGYGIIVLDKADGSTRLEKLADNDSVRYISVDDQIKLRDGINRMRAEEGLAPLTDDEFTITVPLQTITYAGHASNRIIESYKDGRLLKEGVSMWY